MESAQEPAETNEALEDQVVRAAQRHELEERRLQNQEEHTIEAGRQLERAGAAIVETQETQGAEAARAAQRYELEQRRLENQKERTAEAWTQLEGAERIAEGTNPTTRKTGATHRTNNARKAVHAASRRHILANARLITAEENAADAFNQLVTAEVELNRKTASETEETQ